MSRANMFESLIETAQAEGFSVSVVVEAAGVEVGLSGLNPKTFRPYRSKDGAIEVFELPLPGRDTVTHLRVRRDDFQDALRLVLGHYLACALKATA